MLYLLLLSAGLWLLLGSSFPFLRFILRTISAVVPARGKGYYISLVYASHSSLFMIQTDQDLVSHISFSTLQVKVPRHRETPVIEIYKVLTKAISTNHINCIIGCSCLYDDGLIILLVLCNQRGGTYYFSTLYINSHTTLPKLAIQAGFQTYTFLRSINALRFVFK